MSTRNPYSCFCPGSLQTNREIAKDAKKHGFPPKGYGYDWEHNKKFKLTEKWTSIWEKFAGKTYIKPKKLKTGETRDMVHNGQDILSRICVNQRPALVRRAVPPQGIEMAMWAYPSVQYPQTLGELCLEMWDNKISQGKLYINWYLRQRPDVLYHLVVSYPEDFVSIRRAMYHRPGKTGTTNVG